MILQSKRPFTVSSITVEFQTEVLEYGSVWYRMVDIKTNKWMEWERI